MLSKLEVRNRRGTLLTLPFYDDNSGYKIVSVDGLQPVSASLVSSSYAGIDGEQYHSSRRNARDIKISLDFDPDWAENTITNLRKKLYSFFMPQSEVFLRFYETSGLYLDISGRVEDFLTALFSKDPDVEIPIRCFQPDLVDPRIITLSGNTVSDNTDTIIDYPGTVDTGVILTLMPQRSLSSFTIYNQGEDNALHQLDFTGDLIAGDVLVVSSLRGAKGITLTRATVSQSYLYGRSAQSSWIDLIEGENRFRVHAIGDPIPYELEYVVRYGGL
jgi:hypothetical protein